MSDERRLGVPAVKYDISRRGKLEDLRGVVIPPLRRRIMPIVFVTFCGAFEMSLPVPW